MGAAIGLYRYLQHFPIASRVSQVPSHDSASRPYHIEMDARTAVALSIALRADLPTATREVGKELQRVKDELARLELRLHDGQIVTKDGRSFHGYLNMLLWRRVTMHLSLGVAMETLDTREEFREWIRRLLDADAVLDRAPLVEGLTAPAVPES